MTSKRNGFQQQVWNATATAILGLLEAGEPLSANQISIKLGIGLQTIVRHLGELLAERPRRVYIQRRQGHQGKGGRFTNFYAPGNQPDATLSTTELAMLANIEDDADRQHKVRMAQLAREIQPRPNPDAWWIPRRDPQQEADHHA